RPDLRDHLHGLAAVGGLGHDLDVVGQLEQGFHALAYQGLVVNQADADHAGFSIGSRMSSAKPCPRPVMISTRPPNSARRSCMPRNPLPRAWPGSAPRPSSRAWTRASRPSRLMLSQRVRAPAWRTALVMISWVQRSSTWARSGSSM